jgi:ribosome-binding protein aMBF1 (putative translation factor)
VRESAPRSGDFARGLLRARMDRGLSQTDLALAIGTSQATIVSWEKGYAKPEYDQFAPLRRFFGWPHPFVRPRR